MNIREYTFINIIENIKSNRKIVLKIFLVFLLVGVLVGIIHVVCYEQPRYSYDDTIVGKINLDFVEKDEAYYYMAYKEIKGTRNALKAYVSYLQQVTMSGESREQVVAFEEELNKFETIYQEMSSFYLNEGPIIDTSNAEEYLKKKIEKLENTLVELEQRLEKVNAGGFSALFIETTESQIYSQQITTENEIEVWNVQLSNLSNNAERNLEDINRKMDRYIQETSMQLNMYVEDFNSLIQDLEKLEQYDIVYNPYMMRSYNDEAGMTNELSEEDILNNKKNTAIIYAKSIAGLDSAEERLYAYVTFFMMFGATVALLYGALKNRKVEEHAK